MKSLGIYMFLFGIGSMVLYFLGREFVVLSWIENWGPNVGWGIRIGLAVVGAALFFFGKQKEDAAPAA
jgi:hypothetical protein